MTELKKEKGWQKPWCLRWVGEDFGLVSVDNEKPFVERF